MHLHQKLLDIYWYKNQGEGEGSEAVTTLVTASYV